MNSFSEKMKEWLKSTPFFKPLKYLLAMSGRSTYPLPYHTVVPAEPFLEQGIKRVGPLTDGGGRPQQFYSYFSEMWGEGYEEHLIRQYSAYLPFIQKNVAAPFLDIGCGAGEFVEFLSAREVVAQGVDMNAEEVARASMRGLNVQCGDALDYLNNHEIAFSGVSMLQVVEHLPPESLFRLVPAIYRALRPGGIAIVETINTKHPLAFHTFYMDPTHTRPIPSDYLVFLLQWHGFVNVNIIYTLPMAHTHRQGLDPSTAYFNYALIASKPSSSG
jgi:O-antigen chain-terminating methyltransferase